MIYITFKAFKTSRGTSESIEYLIIGGHRCIQENLCDDHGPTNNNSTIVMWIEISIDQSSTENSATLPNSTI